MEADGRDKKSDKQTNKALRRPVIVCVPFMMIFSRKNNQTFYPFYAFNIFLPLSLYLPNVVLPSRFQNKVLNAYFFTP
jgi:hypothetical protein